MKTIYILLTRTNTIFSRVIRFLTAAPFTHAAVSIAQSPAAFLEEAGDVLCQTGFYSFGRKNPWLPFPAGFTLESGEGGYLRTFPETQCALLAIDIAEEAYEAICVRLAKMEKTERYYRYNLLGALLCGVGIPFPRRRRYFCSQFVADLLARSGAVALPKPVHLMRPVDFAFLYGARVVYMGTVGELLTLHIPALPPALYDVRLA